MKPRWAPPPLPPPDRRLSAIHLPNTACCAPNLHNRFRPHQTFSPACETPNWNDYPFHNQRTPPVEKCDTRPVFWPIERHRHLPCCDHFGDTARRQWPGMTEPRTATGHRNVETAVFLPDFRMRTAVVYQQELIAVVPLPQRLDVRLLQDTLQPRWPPNTKRSREGDWHPLFTISFPRALRSSGDVR